MKVKRTFYLSVEVSDLLNQLPRSVTLSDFVEKALEEALRES